MSGQARIIKSALQNSTESAMKSALSNENAEAIRLSEEANKKEKKETEKTGK